MKLLHILTSGAIGGIERLCLDFAKKRQDDAFVFAKGDGMLIHEYLNANKNVFIFGKDERMTFKMAYKFANYVFRIADNGQFDAVILHGQASFFWIIVRVLKRRITGINVFVYVHENESLFLAFERMSLCLMKKSLNGIIAISEDVQNSLIKKFSFLKNKIYVNYNGIDLEKFNPKEHFDDGKEIRLVYVGRLIEEKGVQNILQALADCRDMPVTLDIIGDGEYRKVLENLTSSLGIQGMVEFLGMQQDVANLLPNYNFFIHLPQCEEGFGITVAEAMACGLICIVNDRGAMTELIQDGYNGFVLPAGQSCDLRQLFSDLLHGNYDLKIMRENAVKSAQAFSINKTVERLEDIVISSHE